MIKFDSNLLRCEYVFVKKITPTYIYITKTVNGHVFKNSNSVRGTFKNQKVSKLRIHKNVATSYFKHNAMSEFKDSGRVSCIAFYDDIVLSIDVQSLSSLSALQNKEWRSPLDIILSGVNNIIPNTEDIFINGKEILWFDPTSTLKTYVSNDQSFCLRKVKYLSLSKIGVNVVKKKVASDSDTSTSTSVAATEDENADFSTVKTIRTIGSSFNLSSSDIASLDFDVNFIKPEEVTEAEEVVQSVAFVRDSHVLCYYPNGEQDEDLFVFSPVLYDSSSTKDAKTSEKSFTNVTNFLSNVENQQNKTFLNLNFALMAGKTIGAQYGFEETEILNIEDIIFETKTISLYKIVEKSRSLYPIDIHPFVGLSWLFKFIYKEKDLNVLRDLSTLFTRVLNNGFISEENISNKFKEGKSDSDITLRKYNSVFNKKLVIQE